MPPGTEYPIADSLGRKYPAPVVRAATTYSSAALPAADESARVGADTVYPMLPFGTTLATSSHPTGGPARASRRGKDCVSTPARDKPPALEGDANSGAGGTTFLHTSYDKIDGVNGASSEYAPVNSI